MARGGAWRSFQVALMLVERSESRMVTAFHCFLGRWIWIVTLDRATDNTAQARKKILLIINHLHKSTELFSLSRWRFRA
jgi:hypothetical protein